MATPYGSRMKERVEHIVPLAREELEVGKRAVERGRIRVKKTVRSREELVEQPLQHDEVTVERVPVNREIDAPPQPRYERDALVIPVIEEVLVTRKQLVLKEEIFIRRRSVEGMHQERVTLRSEDVEIERQGRGDAGRNEWKEQSHG
jgi:uncharacterized protein (TIGR02271 family)